MKNTNLFYLAMIMFLVLLLGYFSYEVMRPFFYPLAWAVVFSILFYPVYRFILSHLGRRTLAVFLTVCVILLVIIVPALYLTLLLVHEVASLSSLMETGRFDILQDALRHPLAQKALGYAGSLANMTEDQMLKAAGEQIAGLGRKMLGGIARWIGGLISTVLDFLIMTLALFFMLRDASLFLRKIRGYLPFSNEQKDAIMKRAGDIIFSTLYGGVVVAAAQGTAGGIVFALLGISTPVVWGFVIALFSLLPLLGPGIVWGPAAVYLFAQGSVVKGILMIVAGIGIAAIENVLRPLIVGSRTKLHFLVIFFSVIGGVQFFGMIGFILGPVVVALFVSVLDAFGRHEGVFTGNGV